jgi:hypothetical protein
LDPDQGAPPPFCEKEGIYGGFVASQVQTSSYPAVISADPSAEVLTSDRSCLAQTTETFEAHGSPVIAHSFEFVALPGRAEGVQAEIPTAMRHAFRDIDGFVGSMVLVSEQESRLVTVITLWTGSNRLELCGESEKRLKRWLLPYVDRWLRTRRFASFVAAPDRFPPKARAHGQPAAQENSVRLQ